MIRTLPLLALLALPVAAQAQTTGGIPGPAVRADERSAQFRLAFAPGEGVRDDRWAARLHYQQGLSDDLRARIVLQGSDFETGDFETIFLQGELQWEIDSDPGWAKALRFDARLAENDDGADQLGLVSINQFRLGERAFARADIFTNIQVGARRSDGIGVEFRGQVGYKANARTTLVLETFNALGRGAKFGEFKRNAERLGPGVSHSLDNGASLFGSVLFGLNDSTADADFRIWVTQSF